MILNLHNKNFSEQPAPSRETLFEAVNDASEFCERLSRDIRNASKISLSKYLPRFFSDAFRTISTKLFAIKKLSTISTNQPYSTDTIFRNEAYSISRDNIEIIVDLGWIWHYVEFENNADIAERLCKQFYLNAPARFIYEFDFIRNAYPNSPFVKKFYNEQKLMEHLEKAKKVVGTYVYQQNWRSIPNEVKRDDYKWKTKCEKTAIVMEKVAKLKKQIFIEI